jgi:hypothetical protein
MPRAPSHNAEGATNIQTADVHHVLMQHDEGIYTQVKAFVRF